MNSTISAWQLSQTAPHGLELVTRPRPAAGSGEAVVRLRAASLNYRDLMARRGDYGPRNPVVPVADGVGEIVELGAGVTQHQIGDRVATAYFPGWIEGEPTPEKTTASFGAGTQDGVLADYFVAPAAALVPVPVHLSDPEAAALSCAGVTAWNALFVSGRLRPGDTVLLLGTGGVSLFALQFAKLAGARIIITSSDDAKLERARQLGAHETINYRTDPDWPKAVLALTEGRGVDLAVDTGGGSVLNQVVTCTRLGGSIGLIGVLGGFEAPVSTLQMLLRNIHLEGIFVGSAAMFATMNRAVALHQLRPIIDRVFPFADAPAAYAYLESGKHFGKIAIAR